MYKLNALILLAFLCAGCATTPTYDPVASAIKERVPLNESQLKQVQVGMTWEQVHTLLGQHITVGYAYKESPFKENNYLPLTISNPYKTEKIQTPKGECTVEYYVTAVHQPDGVVSDDELMPVTFCNSVVASKGWDNLKK